MTITELVSEYALEAAELGRKSRAWTCITREIARFFGGDTHIVEAIDTAKVRAWIAQCRESGNKPATLQSKLNILRQLCRLANESGVAVKFPKRIPASIVVDNARTRTLSDKELRALKAAMTPGDWEICVFAAKTGLRSQEVFLLEVSDVDFRQGSIVIRKTKTGKQRVIPMVGVVREICAKAAKGRRRYVINPDGCDKWVKRLPMAEYWKHNRFRPALLAAGIEDFHWHDWRHQACTTMIENGADHMAVIDLMGWDSPKCLRRYTNLRLKTLARAAVLA